MKNTQHLPGKKKTQPKPQHLEVTRRRMASESRHVPEASVSHPSSLQPPHLGLPDPPRPERTHAPAARRAAPPLHSPQAGPAAARPGARPGRPRPIGERSRQSAGRQHGAAATRPGEATPRGPGPAASPAPQRPAPVREAAAHAGGPTRGVPARGSPSPQLPPPPRRQGLTARSWGTAPLMARTVPLRQAREGSAGPGSGPTASPSPGPAASSSRSRFPTGEAAASAIPDGLEPPPPPARAHRSPPTPRDTEQATAPRWASERRPPRSRHAPRSHSLPPLPLPHNAPRRPAAPVRGGESRGARQRPERRGRGPGTRPCGGEPEQSRS